MTSADTATLRARVAQLCLPGPKWYIAVCESCKWMGMSWKNKGWAVAECSQHNLDKHPTAACRHCGEPIMRGAAWSHVVGPGSTLIRCDPDKSGKPYGLNAEPMCHPAESAGGTGNVPTE